METEPAPFVRLGFMAGETECCLGISQQKGTSRIVRLVASGTRFFRLYWMGALFVSKCSLVMTRKAKCISLLFEQGMLLTIVTIMAGKALPFAGRLVSAASDFRGRVTSSIHHGDSLVLCFHRRFITMATLADFFLWNFQQDFFITGMDGMACNTLLFLEGLVVAGLFQVRFVVAIETEFISFFFCCDTLFNNGVTGITFPIGDRFVDILF